MGARLVREECYLISITEQSPKVCGMHLILLYIDPHLNRGFIYKQRCTGEDTFKMMVEYSSP